ncbi:MAG: response regulator [Bacteroidetes bacterium]|nr:MAG: response regulator [Bacteroidota bacterium]
MAEKKILVVDDSSSIRALLKMALEDENYKVTLGEDGLDALKYLDGTHFDLVITDLHMPNMNGLELIHEVRKMDWYKYTPILFLTTETKTDLKIKAKKEGATGWLTKPFDNEKLKRVVKRVLR